MLQKIKKLFFSCIFILLAIGLFLTCDHPNNPFSNNMGEKVVVEPPTIVNITPVSGSFLQGVVTFTANARAYINVEKVEVYIFEDKANGQREVGWTEKGIRLTGSLKQKRMEFDFDTSKYNNWDFNTNQLTAPRDGPIRMKFRIFDTTMKPIESIELIYIIKNNPSVIKMAYPSITDIKNTDEPAKIQWGGDIRGQVIDRRGLRPGYPQIKIWKEGATEPGDEGWASLFLTGYDDMQKESGATPAGPGVYADRRTQRVINVASFSLRLAEFDIVPDPENPDLRKVQYRVNAGKHILYDAGAVYNFIIKTSDVMPDPSNGSFPIMDSPSIVGYFPPKDYDTPNEDNFTYRGTPVRILIFNSDTRPTVEINNDDKDQSELKNKPNIYMTEPSARKIARQTGDIFRLRLFVYFDKGGQLNDASLQWQHQSSGRSGVLAGTLAGPPTVTGTPGWDAGYDPNNDNTGLADFKDNPNGGDPIPGTLFSFTAKGDMKDAGGKQIFTSSSEPYRLIFTVTAMGNSTQYDYWVYLDGNPPEVSIRSVLGAAKDPAGGAVLNSGGLINQNAYTVNGNIQAVVDSFDNETGIMSFSPGADMGANPPDSGSYPMVKWIVEGPIPGANPETVSTPTGNVINSLQAYRSNPTWDNLRDFRDITDNPSSSLTSLPSGWVRIPLTTGNDSDKANHFKLNTAVLSDKQYYWLYVIAMDGVQNLGFTAQKIYVDQDSDKPTAKTPPLGATNAGGANINGPENLKVTVTVNTGNNTRSRSGNWNAYSNTRNNVLEGNDGISLVVADDDGINRASGVTIILTDLNNSPAPNSPVTLNSKQIESVLNSGIEKELSGTLTQERMAKFFYGEAYTGNLKDGMYKIEFKVKDDPDKKVWIDGVDPGSIESETIAYYFAVYKNPPLVEIKTPDERAWGSDKPIPVNGTIKSRFEIQSAYITFTPNVAASSPSLNELSLPNPVTFSLASPAQDSNYNYIYNWEYSLPGLPSPGGVIFNPKGAGGNALIVTDDPLRSFTVEAYDLLGNLGSEVRTVQIDSEPPEVVLSEFNHGRPPVTEIDNTGGVNTSVQVTYVYGKVAFTVSASDTNGMSEEVVNGVKMSGIKWWVLPSSVATEPTWNTGYAAPYNPATNPDYDFVYTNAAMSGSWTGYGNFPLDPIKDDGKYTGIIDTRYLTDKQEYKLYIIAMDRAGNTSFRKNNSDVNIGVGYETFKVDQSKDYPVVYEDTLSPPKDSIFSGQTLKITGTVSDADLFNPAKKNTYVQIRYPDSVSGGVITWVPWENIDGEIDPGGSIIYTYPKAGSTAAAYFNGDGIKEYQIRVTDEPEGPSAGTVWYGKNPDGAKPADGYKYHGPVTIVFPMDKDNPLNQNPKDTYKFFVDKTPPEIFFNLYDPNTAHENHLKNQDGTSAPRPTFSDWEQLKRALNNKNPADGAELNNGKGNYVKEYKLVDLNMDWSFAKADGNHSFSKLILSNPPDQTPAGEYKWNLNGPTWTGPVSVTTSDDARLKKVFDEAPQGLQIIAFEATDLAGFTGRASWSFAKDTQGPSIEFRNISRSIKRVRIPANNDKFPAGWPPYSTKWNADWDSFTTEWTSVTWREVIENWPSEYAFKNAAEVISALDKENKQSPSTVMDLDPADNATYVIKGTFSDEYSSVRILLPANTKTYFYYRFKDRNGNLNMPASVSAAGVTLVNDQPITGWQDGSANKSTTWIRKEIEQGSQEKSADWEIKLNPENGFIGKDGQNLLDIRVADTAGNISEIFNVAFLVDRAPPLLGGYLDEPADANNTPRTQFKNGEFKISKIGSAVKDPQLLLPEDQRVISGAGAGAADFTVKFSVSGRVNDYNLSNLRVILGQDGTSAYTVTATVNIDPLVAGNGVTLAPKDVVAGALADTYPDTADQYRLSLAGPYEEGTKNKSYTAASTGTPEWEWTFNILEKDVSGLRKAAGANADSARRFIKVTASDKSGKREGPVDWIFYLDTKKPDIEYTNLDKGKGGSAFEGNVRLSGLVSDDTKIRDVKYLIGKWNYGNEEWRWWNGTDWDLDNTAAKPIPDPDSWASAFSVTNPARQTTMEWTIDQTTLTNYPLDLFNTEGKYRLDLYVTDYSYGDGNPRNTTLGDNTDTADGFKDNGYNPATGAGEISGRVFYIDRLDPILKWVDIENKTYFRNEDSGSDKGKVIFKFEAGDGNTLQSWSAVIRNRGGKILTSDGNSLHSDENGDIKWDVGTEKNSTAIATPTGIDDTKNINIRTFEIKPYMIVDPSDAASNPLDLLPTNPLPTYTLTITVKDGAGRESSISKQFTLDNTPPRFVQDKFNPLSYKRRPADGTPNPEELPYPPETIINDGYNPNSTTRSYSFDAISGKLNIRGNTEDNSNQINSISYYVVSNSGGTGIFASSDFKQPKEIPLGSWLSSAQPIEIGSDPKAIELDEGTLFAWTIKVPRTSQLLDENGGGLKYVQRSNTGGTSIKNVADKPYGTYIDFIAGAGGTGTPVSSNVPKLTFQDLNNPYESNNKKKIYGDEKVGLITIYVRAEDMAGNVAYDVLKYWIWPEGDRPIVTAINNPDSSKPEVMADRLLNGTIRLSGMAKDNERVRFVWFRVLDPDGIPYGTGEGTNEKPLSIPKWEYQKSNGDPISGNWEEAKATPPNQTPVEGSKIGSRRSDDPGPLATTDIGNGWYMANGGNSREVSWWASINADGELNPSGNDIFTYKVNNVTTSSGTITVSSAALAGSVVTFNTAGFGTASAISVTGTKASFTVSGGTVGANDTYTKVGDVAGATTFDGTWKGSNGRIIYLQRKEESRVLTVEVRAQDISWNDSLNNNNGGWMNDDNGMASMMIETASAAMTGVTKVKAWVVANQPEFKNRKIAQSTSAAAEAAGSTSSKLWAVIDSISLNGRSSSSFKVTVTHDIGLSAIRWSPTQWYKNPALTTDIGSFRANPLMDTFNLLASYTTTQGFNMAYMPGISVVYLNENGDGYLIGDETTAINAVTTGKSGMAMKVVPKVLGSGSTTVYKEYDVLVDINADVLLTKMLANDPAYGTTQARKDAGQTNGSVNYPVYLSASEVSKANPLSIRGDTLLPIDNLNPYGMYTLNRKPAGTAVTIGGEAGDDGPVAGIARVVLWFQKKDSAQGVSWHGTNADELPPALRNGIFKKFSDVSALSQPDWWTNVDLTDSSKYPNVDKPAIGTKGSSTGGDSAIVIDDDYKSVGKSDWGHKLPIGFSEGGLGRIWYVEINSYGLESGPIDLHYVIMDKAGNYQYYKTRLIIMNNVAVIDRVKLATDIRHISWAGTELAGPNKAAASGKKYDKATATPNTWPILKDVRSKVPYSGDDLEIGNDVKKGISDWITANALGADKVIDFNVRNNLFAMRVETTKSPALNKTRNFRLEYVSGATLLTNTGLQSIKAGKVYVINERGTARWGMFGAEGDDWKRGYAFIATVDGATLDQTSKDNIGTGSAWELNSGYPAIGERDTAVNSAASTVPAALQLGDAKYTAAQTADAQSAEFVYANAAFPSIVDTTGPVDVVFPPTGTWAGPTWTNANWSLFILRVFDGDEADFFGDFTIMRVRVNNDDKTRPFAQLYDLNPKTEGQERANIASNEEARSISPMSIGEGTDSNRTKGGLWNIAADPGKVNKPGHIEPRRVGDGAAAVHPSLTSAQMGGAATQDEASITKPWADPAGFFGTTDTVSGRVVLRGYAEDDQRVQRVRLVIGGQNIDILEGPAAGIAAAATDEDSTNYVSAKTGMLAVPAAEAGKVYFTDSIDLYRHRVEWAYIWDTETYPGGNNVVGSVSVRAMSYIRNGAAGNTVKEIFTAANNNNTTANDGLNSDGTTSATSVNIPAPGTLHVAAPNPNRPLEATRPNTSPYNKDFPVNLNKYNSISFNLRPYITGFRRNKSDFSHDTRSRQGRYMFARNEQVVVAGFNLANGTNGANGPNITVGGVASSNIGNANTTALINSHADAKKGDDFTKTTRFRVFTVGSATTGTTGDGVVTLTVNNQPAVNTGSERARANGPPVRPRYIQPWNVEYSPGEDGSTLWDDFTQVHIWQSNDANTGTDRGYFPKGGANMEVFDPSMSIDPEDGSLWSSHNEGGGGGGNTGTAKVGSNKGDGSLEIVRFIDPITNSDIFISPQNSGPGGGNFTNTVWTAYSVIGKPGGDNNVGWGAYGGIWLNGPSGGAPGLNSGLTINTGNNGFNGTEFVARTQYMAESTWYNSSPQTGANVDPAIGPQLNQFKNPHIITYWDGSNEQIHVSYYDTKDGSIKYRYNRRGGPGTVNTTSAPRAWTNLDGGVDAEDETTLAANALFQGQAGVTTTGGRIVGYSNNLAETRTARTATAGGLLPDAGEYNSIALTSDGYPVIAYYDKANQKLKLAISNSTAPIAASAWRIEQDVIPADKQLAFTGTGLYVSMRIDTQKTPNVVHIAAMNSLTKSLVYIRGTLGANRSYANTALQVVDSVGSVGRWCSISLDSDGYPWISYQDESYQGSRDGIKLAYYNPSRYYKGSNTTDNGAIIDEKHRRGQDVDMYNVSVTGWEAMHVPTQFRVENARQGMENYPTRNFTGARNPQTKFWRGAVGYLGQDYFRAAYYVE